MSLFAAVSSSRNSRTEPRCDAWIITGTSSSYPHHPEARTALSGLWRRQLPVNKQEMAETVITLHYSQMFEKIMSYGGSVISRHRQPAQLDPSGETFGL